jgi:hypothetical protein
LFPCGAILMTEGGDDDRNHHGAASNAIGSADYRAPK